jgi:hypothetical protein
MLAPAGDQRGLAGEVETVGHGVLLPVVCPNMAAPAGLSILTRREAGY